MTAALIQWAIATATTIFVALVAFFQWRTAQQKAVLDLFDKRHEIYEIVRKLVGVMSANSPEFSREYEIEFMQVMERAYFFFGDDVTSYLKQLWDDITCVLNADKAFKGPMLPEYRAKISEERRVALKRITEFHSVGKPLFARYMRFSQTVPLSFAGLFWR